MSLESEFKVIIDSHIDEESEDSERIKSGTVHVDIKRAYNEVEKELMREIFLHIYRTPPVDRYRRKKYDILKSFIKFIEDNLQMQLCELYINYGDDNRHYRGNMTMIFSLEGRRYKIYGILCDDEVTMDECIAWNDNEPILFEVDDRRGIKEQLETHHNMGYPKLFWRFFEYLSNHISSTVYEKQYTRTY